MLPPKIKIKGRAQVSRLLWPVIAFILLGTTACRVEIGIGAAAAAPPQRQSLPTPSIASSEPPAPFPSISAPPLVQTESSPTPAQLSAATPIPTSTVQLTPPPILTPTPQPPTPAQMPPTRIIIPAIALDAPVEVADWTVMNQAGVETSTWNVPASAAGWHQNSALPGNGGNVVLSGHHNIGAELFRYLVDLKKGDEILLQADGRAYRYVVTDHFILPERDVSPEQQQQNVQWIMPTTDERLTLVTCWPYTGNSHRLIVVAK